MRRLVFERQAIRQNLDAVRERAGRAAIYAVLTGNAHGAGVVEMAKLLREGGVTRFAVAEAEDAEALRGAGLEEEEILFLRSTSRRAELERLAELDVIFSVGSVEAGMAVNALADERSTVVEVHIRVDCGAGFGGFPAEEVDKICAVYRNLPNVAVSGIYTALDGQSDKCAMEELAVFRTMLDAVRKAGLETGTVHAAGSSSLMHLDGIELDAVRVGSALLGRCRRRKGDGLVRVGYGEVPLDEMTWLPQGHRIGLRKLRRPTRLAILPVGYQNGFGLPPANVTGLLGWLTAWRRQRGRTVKIGGVRAQIVGNIGAIETVVDVTRLRCLPGDLAVFEIDPQAARGFRRELR